MAVFHPTIEAFLRRLQDAVLLIDTQGVVRFANDEAARRLGQSSSDAMLGRSFTDITLRLQVLDDDDQPVPRDMWPSNAARVGAVPAATEVHYRLGEDGPPQWAQSTPTPVFEEDGTLIGHIQQWRDITAQKTADAALRESEERYRRLIEACPDAIIVHCEGILVFANAAAADALGAAKPQDLVGRAVLEFVPPEGHAVVRQRMHAMTVERRDAPLLEERFVRPDGTFVDVEVAGIPFTFGGKPAVQLVIRDVTARKRAERMLRETLESLETRILDRTAELEQANARFSTLIDEAPDAIVVFDVQGIIHMASARAESLFGWPRDGLIGMSVEALIPERWLEAHRLLRLRFAQGETSPLLAAPDDQWARRRDDTEFPMEVHLSPIRDGLDTWIMASVRDVSDRRQAEAQERALIRAQAELAERERSQAALQAEKERLTVTLRSIGDGVIATDTAGRVTMLNPVAEMLVGWTQDEAAGRPVQEVFRILDERTRQPKPGPVGEVLATGSVVELVHRGVLVSRDGQERVIADSGAPIRGPGGEVLGVVLVFRDVTGKERMEAELLRASKLESLGLLAGGIAHDFNNILTGIIAYLSLATETLARDNPVHPWLVEAEKAGMRARDLTYQLLTFSKGGAPIRRPTSLGTIVEDSARFAVAGSSCRVVFDIASDLWTVHVDAGQISQVMQNLVLNAAQAMPFGGTIEVSAANALLDATPLLGAGRYVELRVRDTGTGIAPEVLPHIFDPFFTTKAQGSGLGLATSYAVVRKHDGGIDVSSAAGQGTEFLVRLPASDDLVQEGESRTRRARHAARVLVMDDDPIMRTTARAVLLAYGYEVTTARDGGDAVALYADAQESAHPFDLVVLDLTVPGAMGGREALDHLRARHPQVRAVVASGYSEDPVMAQHAQHGFAGVVIKPYTAQHLDEVLQSVLSQPIADGPT